MSKETFWVDIYKAVVVDFVEHPVADLLSSVFKTCPLEVFEHGVTVPGDLSV